MVAEEHLRFDYEKLSLQARDVEQAAFVKENDYPKESCDEKQNRGYNEEALLNDVHCVLLSPELGVSAEIFLAHELGCADNISVAVVMHCPLADAVLITAFFCALCGPAGQLAECCVDAGIKPRMCGF